MNFIKIFPKSYHNKKSHYYTSFIIPFPLCLSHYFDIPYKTFEARDKNALFISVLPLLLLQKLNISVSLPTFLAKIRFFKSALHKPRLQKDRLLKICLPRKCTSILASITTAPSCFPDTILFPRMHIPARAFSAGENGPRCYKATRRKRVSEIFSARRRTIGAKSFIRPRRKARNVPRTLTNGHCEIERSATLPRQHGRAKNSLEGGKRSTLASTKKNRD